MTRLMAVLGIMHTHQRHDRDDFIKYNEDCVMEDNFGLGLGPLAQFEKFSKEKATTFGIPYNCNSIMHFTSEQFGKPNCKVLEPKDNKCKELGNPTGTPTSEDWQMVKKAQKCETVNN